MNYWQPETGFWQLSSIYRQLETGDWKLFFNFSINIYPVGVGYILTDPFFLKIMPAVPASTSYILNTEFTLSKVEGTID
jgi:hypothetical protein